MEKALQFLFLLVHKIFLTNHLDGPGSKSHSDWNLI